MGSKFPNLDRSRNLRIQMDRCIYTQQCHLCMLHHFDNSDWHIHQCLKKEKIPTLLNNEHLNIHGCGVSKLKGLLETYGVERKKNIFHHMLCLSASLLITKWSFQFYSPFSQSFPSHPGMHSQT